MLWKLYEFGSGTAVDLDIDILFCLSPAFLDLFLQLLFYCLLLRIAANLLWVMAWMILFLKQLRIRFLLSQVLIYCQKLSFRSLLTSREAIVVFLVLNEYLIAFFLLRKRLLLIESYPQLCTHWKLVILYLAQLELAVVYGLVSFLFTLSLLKRFLLFKFFYAILHILTTDLLTLSHF